MDQRGELFSGSGAAECLGLVMRQFSRVLAVVDGVEFGDGPLLETVEGLPGSGDDIATDAGQILEGVERLGSPMRRNLARTPTSSFGVAGATLNDLRIRKLTGLVPSLI